MSTKQSPAMYGQNAYGWNAPAVGVPVSGVYYYRASNVIAGGEAGLRAGAGGVSIGRFGWAEPDGTVLNSRVSAQGLRGVIAIHYADWRGVFWDEVTHTWKIREGLPATMIAKAPGVWVDFPNGAVGGAQVYTDPLDGLPVAGYAVGLEATLWTVGRACGPGGLSLITTWNPIT